MIERLYKKIGLFEKIEKSFSLNRTEIFSVLQANMDEDPGAEFTTDLSKRRYKLKVSGDEIRFKERKKFEDSQTLNTYIIGTFEDAGGSTIFNLMIFIKPMVFLSTTAYNVLLIPILLYGAMVLEGNSKVLLAVFIILIPVAYGRSLYEWNSALSKMKYEFERELDFIFNNVEKPGSG